MWRKHWWLPRLSSSIVNEIDLSLHHVKVLLYWCYDIRYLSFWWVIMENAHVYFETYVLEVSLKMKKENQHENCWAKQKNRIPSSNRYYACLAIKLLKYWKHLSNHKKYGPILTKYNEWFWFHKPYVTKNIKETAQ